MPPSMKFPWNQTTRNMYSNVTSSDEEIEKYSSSDSEGEAFINSRRPNSRRSTIVSHLWSAALGSLLAILVGLVLFAYTSLLNVNITQGSVVPDLPIETVIWKSNDDFTTAPSPATNQVWDLLLPAGDGFIAVENPSKYGLRPGGPMRDGRETYGISMYHQIHCLRLLRDVYWAFVEPDNKYNEMLHGEHGKHLKGNAKQDDPTHVTHCFDYLRKAIQCAGDMSVEHAGGFKPFTHVDGEDVAHKCRSFSAAQSFMHKNGAPMHHGVPTQ